MSERTRERISRASLVGGPVRSSLPPQTQAGFVAAVLAVFLIAFLSYRSLAWRVESANLVSHTLEVSRGLESLLSLYKDAETGQRGFLLTGDPKYLEPYEAASSQLEPTGGHLRVLLADNPVQLERLGLVTRLGAEKMTELAQTIEQRRDGQTDAALRTVRTDIGMKAMDSIRATIASMKEAEQSLLAVRNREWETATVVSTRLTWGGSGLLLLLIIGAAALSSRDFRVQRVQGWLRSGESELAGRMRGVEGVEGLGTAIAGFLGDYLEVRVGAIYFADATGRLRRVGGYALPEGNDARAAEAGGLTREAFRQNHLLETRNVPDEFFPVSAGVGRARARHLIIVPTTADGRPNGVLELGFLGGVLPSDLELLRLASEPIGLALRAAKDRAELSDSLEETQRQAEELQSQQEELNVQNEELEQQSKTLQDSQARLENQQAELEQINAHLEEQTDALSAQRDHLVRARGELQQASAYKSEFLANMSHELRTPLNSSLILAKLLADNRDGNLSAEQVKFAETIYSAGNDLLTLINDILDLSKIEAGKLDVRPEEVTLGRLVSELGDAFRPVARDKGITFETVVAAETPPTIVTDPTRLRQILNNLLSNALKFTERGGVSLDVRRAGTRLAFEVKDTGIGIAADQHQAIFEAFRQADGTTSRKYGGTGLGLSISRDLSRLLGGELTLESAPGRGSTFTLFVPERLEGPAPVPPTPAVRARPPRSLPQPTAPTGSSPHANGGARDRSILIVEDDPAFAAIVQRLATELDFRTVVATTGEEALTLAEESRPSAIILDIGLPDRSGLSVLDTLKHRASTRHIPVHIVSVSDHTRAALEMGAAGYAIEPTAREALVNVLRTLETKFTQTLRRVLIVEDDEVARDSTCRLLGGGDVETVAVGTAREALEQLSAKTFDCMVLDLSLPDRSGFDLLEEMSASERFGFPPVIVYTGRSLSRAEEERLRKLSHTIVIKGARSPERLLDEVTLFLHRVESDLPPDQQRMLKDARNREAVFEGKRVLIVEDDVRNIFALSSVLEPRGAKVEIARNGQEALDRLASAPGIDLILMDVMMPEMDGLEATRRIRADAAHASLPIIALTAKARADDREQCLAAGANDYIAKPLDVDKLLSLARVWMPK